MNPYVSITFRTFTIWIMSSAINCILCGVYLGIIGFENESFGSWMFVVLIASLFFSIPGFFIFWITMLILIYKKIYARDLFRAGLNTIIILSAATAYLSTPVFNQAGQLWISILIILSAIISIMMHFNLFKKIGVGNEKENLSIYNQNTITQ